MKLSTKKHWENNWSQIRLPAKSIKCYSNKLAYKKIVKIFKKYNFRPKTFLEIGGCPGRWADFFNTNFQSICDVIDYEKKGCALTKKNFKLLKIKGKIYNQDIFNNTLSKEYYDVVLSAGLVEHFDHLEPIFDKHWELLKKGGFLIISVPNIKKSKFYDYFAKKHKESYRGYRAVTKKELIKIAKRKKLKIIFCDYLGVINLGVVKRTILKNNFFKKIGKFFDYLFFGLERIITFSHIKKETKMFSPNIYLIAKK
ncbi:MAG: methyltransferase domain-containing protein [Patescibacteria group bacterium]|nr:methyltransferase domain-containing protein [Patescibacteria group bacterium]